MTAGQSVDGQVEKTVLFADIAGSTRLYVELGDQATRRMLSDCLDLMESIVRERGGHVARRIGDEILCTFATVNDAALTAMRLQSQVSEGDANGLFPSPMRIRVGFEHGPIIEAPDALYGHVVHTAARVASLAKAGQILTTSATLAQLNPAIRSFARFHERAVLKGQGGERDIHEIIWNVHGATAAARPGGESATRPAAPRLVELEHDGHIYRVDTSRPRLELGRDHSCDVCVGGEAVSQLHARVLWNADGLQIEDVSTNGTFIEEFGSPQRIVHHGRAPLHGKGLLHLGDPHDATRGATLRYYCRLAGV